MLGSVSRRLRSNAVAQMYSQAVTLAIQFASIPLLVTAWGIETYGVWLLLTALPAYLTLSDFGFTFVAKNEMSMQVAANRREEAVVTFQSILALLLMVVGVGTTLIVLAVWLVPIEAIFNLAGNSLTAARSVLTAQVASVLLYQLFLLFCAGLRADGRPATETFAAATSRLFETLAICPAALAGFDIAGAAICGLVARLIALAAIMLHAHQSIHWLPIGLGRASSAKLRALLVPSLSYMLVPISNAFLIQGPVVILGAVAGPASVAIFSITRSVTRLGMAGANMLNYTFTPEYSFAFGKGDSRALRTNIKQHFAVAGAGTVAYAIAILILSDFAIGMLSRGQVSAICWLTVALAAAVTLEVLWSTLFAPIAAVNAHKFAAGSLALCATVVITLAVLLHPTPLTLAGALIGVHAIMLAVCLIVFARVFGNHVRRQAPSEFQS